MAPLKSSLCASVYSTIKQLCEWNVMIFSAFVLRKRNLLHCQNFTRSQVFQVSPNSS